MVKVWRTSDWALETDIISPFINAPGTTLFRRLSWAPDGAHVAAANAVNGIQCIAAIINRDDWNADVSLVGHTLPIEVTVSIIHTHTHRGDFNYFLLLVLQSKDVLYEG